MPTSSPDRTAMSHFVSPANAVTVLGLWGAVSCALLAASGRPAAGIVALVVSGVCDLLDGAVARRFPAPDEVSRFGARLDTIADICSFGLAPTVLFWSLGMRSPAEIAVLIGFVTCAAWRLAYFDTVGLEGNDDRKRYIGLPTTFVALIVPLALLPAFAYPDLVRVLAVASASVIAVAMVSPVRIPKPGGVWYVVLPALALVVGATYTLFGHRFPVAP